MRHIGKETALCLTCTFRNLSLFLEIFHVTEMLGFINKGIYITQSFTLVNEFSYFRTIYLIFDPDIRI